MAAFYDIIPKGVRILGIRQIQSGQIHSSFGANGMQSPYYLKERVTAEKLSRANNNIRSIFSPLKSLSSELYEQLVLGEYEISGSAKVNVTGVGGGIGISDKMALIFVFPYYRAKVSIHLNTIEKNNISKIKAKAQSLRPQSVEALIAQSTLQSIDDIVLGNFQSVLVNQFAYRELGNWEGQGFGDSEMGILYNIFQSDHSGVTLGMGLVLPTGKVDDPDILQDFSFGDGQWDLYGEILTGVTVFHNFDLGFKAKYTIQLPSSKEYRVPESADYPVTSTKGIFYEDLGEILALGVGLTYHATDWLRFQSEGIKQWQQRASYSSDHPKANQIFTQNSDSEKTMARLSVALSSVRPFLNERFLLPLEISLGGEFVIDGKNSENYRYYFAELRMFF